MWPRALLFRQQNCCWSLPSILTRRLVAAAAPGAGGCEFDGKQNAWPLPCALANGTSGR
jgi:hypothetical protein